MTFTVVLHRKPIKVWMMNNVCWAIWISAYPPNSSTGHDEQEAINRRLQQGDPRSLQSRTRPPSPKEFRSPSWRLRGPTLLLTLFFHSFVLVNRIILFFCFLYLVDHLGSCPSTWITEESAKTQRLCQHCELQCRWWHSSLRFRRLGGYSLGLGNWPH